MSPRATRDDLARGRSLRRALRERGCARGTDGVRREARAELRRPLDRASASCTSAALRTLRRSEQRLRRRRARLRPDDDGLPSMRSDQAGDLARPAVPLTSTARRRHGERDRLCQSGKTVPCGKSVERSDLDGQRSVGSVARRTGPLKRERDGVPVWAKKRSCCALFRYGYGMTRAAVVGWTSKWRWDAIPSASPESPT